MAVDRLTDEVRTGISMDYDVIHMFTEYKCGNKRCKWTGDVIGSRDKEGRGF